MNLSLYHRRPPRFFCGDTFVRPQCHSATPLNPAAIPGLALWLKADGINGLADGANVSSWNDSSGLANHAVQATAANQPIYRANIINGKPVVRFDGTNDYLTVNGNLTPIDVFAVVRFSNANDSGLVVGNAPAAAAVFTRFSGNISVSDEFNTIQAANNSTAFQLLSARHHASGYLRINGTTVATGSVSAAEQSPTYIGADADTLQNLNGDLAELLIYNTTLSGSNRDAIETYLNQKYAIY